MNNTLRTLIAFSLFAALFARPAFAQQVQLTLVQIKADESLMIVEETEELKSEKYTAMIPFTEPVKETYEVEVEYTEVVMEKYTVEVPYTEMVTGDDGKAKNVQRIRTEERTRAVPKKKTRTDTRTRMIPVQRVRKETKVRQVPVTRQRKTPAGATYAYVWGERISSEKMKELAAEKPITVLQMPLGETLSDLHREILHPNLIVMTTPAEEASSSDKR